jgi:hypothetical protein
VLVPPTTFDSTDDNEPKAAASEAFDETPTPDVSVQPSWLARLLLLFAFLLLTALPLRSPHRDSLL